MAEMSWPRAHSNCRPYLDNSRLVLHREVEQVSGTYALREKSEAYDGNLRSETEPLSLENTVFWNENAGTAETSRGPTLSDRDPLRWKIKIKLWLKFSRDRRRAVRHWIMELVW